MNEELYFNDELRKCLNAAGLSDCGENDAWNYWYQRVHKAHDQAVDRVTEAQRAENAKLREELADAPKCETCEAMLDCDECLRADVSHKERSRLSAENAKLRELVRDYERCSVHADCGLCEYDGKLSTHCPLSPCFPDADELRELRIEVDDA